jgi:hypothetical protein
MDQDAVVSDQTESGKRLIEALAAAEFDVRVAFWAKPTDEGKWYLYLASPIVDDQGPTEAYRFVHRILRKTPDVWIDPFEIKVIGMNDSLSEAALEVMKPRVPDSPFAIRNPRPYPGMTRLGGATLGGVSIDGAYIYPLPQPGVSA